MRHNCIEKDIIQETLSGKRQRGRPKTTWLGDIIQWTDVLRKSAPSNGQQKSMEKDDP